MESLKMEHFLLFQVGTMTQLISRPILCLFFLLFLAACTKSEQVRVDSHPKSNNIERAAGTSSGGGGFADSEAKDALNIAKYAIAQIIENTSDEVFTNLPKGKGKDWLVNIIRSIEYRDVNESRYGRPLKFNYDKDKNIIYVTNYFILTFPAGRFQTKTNIEKMGIITNLIMDILHEVSHFYGIGLTELTDDNSDRWVELVMKQGLSEVYVCDNLKNAVISLHRASGIARANGDTFDKKIQHRHETAAQWSDALPTQIDESNFFPYENRSRYQQYVRLARQKYAEQIPNVYEESNYYHNNFLGEPLATLDVEPRIVEHSEAMKVEKKYSGSFTKLPLLRKFADHYSRTYGANDGVYVENEKFVIHKFVGDAPHGYDFIANYYYSYIVDGTPAFTREREMFCKYYLHKIKITPFQKDTKVTDKEMMELIKNP